VLAAAGIYGDIARKAAERGGEERVGTSVFEKLGWIVRALGQARARKRLFPAAQRDELWTRPRH
jgi:phytoene synthase